MCEFCRLGGTTTHRPFPAEPFNPELCGEGRRKQVEPLPPLLWVLGEKAGEKMRWEFILAWPLSDPNRDGEPKS